MPGPDNANPHNVSVTEAEKEPKYWFRGTKVLIIDIIPNTLRKINITLGI